MFPFLIPSKTVNITINCILNTAGCTKSRYAEGKIRSPVESQHKSNPTIKIPFTLLDFVLVKTVNSVVLRFKYMISLYAFNQLCIRVRAS